MTFLDPACRGAIIAATAYITKQTTDFPYSFAPLFQSDTHRACVAAVDAAARRGDLEGTRDACRFWWTCVIDYARTAVHKEP